MQARHQNKVRKYNLLKIKTYQAGSFGHKYGFNTQEKDDEPKRSGTREDHLRTKTTEQIYGEGNSTTAEYWQYDSRLGRRWNVDPRPNLSISSYACFGNNPIAFSDIDGDTARYGCSSDKLNVFLARDFINGFNEKFKKIRDNDKNILYSQKDGNNPLRNQKVVDQEPNSVTKVYRDGRWVKINGHVEYSSQTGVSLLERLPLSLKVPLGAVCGIFAGLKSLFKREELKWGMSQGAKVSMSSQVNLFQFGIGNYNKYNKFSLIMQ